MNIREIGLEELLDQREYRQSLILKAQKDFPKHTIISYKLNIPGPLKNNEKYLYVFEEGLSLLSKLKIHDDLRFNPTGPEAILLSSEDKETVKKQMISIEENFALGRLYDLDVLGISRNDLDVNPRKCLICEDEAHNCSRSKRHSLKDVLSRIDQMIENYKND